MVLGLDAKIFHGSLSVIKSTSGYNVEFIAHPQDISCIYYHAMTQHSIPVYNS